MAMILLHLPTLALNATATLVYPLYSSYKAVTSSATSLAQMEVWLVYWSVFACWTLVESLFGFLWSWIPFYYEIRLIFNIWLVAPQTRGATWIYVNHLHPFLQKNQQQIDSLIDEGKTSLRAKVDATLGGLWSASLGGGSAEAQVPAPAAAASGKEARHKPPGAGSAPAPPTQHNPAQAPMSLFGNLFKTYAPVAIASAKSFLESKAPPPSTQAYSIPPSSSTHPIDQKKREEAVQRRRQLESQLAALDAAGVTSSTSSSSNSSDEDVHGVHAAPASVMQTRSPRGSFGAQQAVGMQGSLRNRLMGGGGRQTVKAGQAMGESYDLLDQNELPPLHPQQASPARRASATRWAPWSPKPDN